MKKSIGLLIALNRRGILLLGIALSLAVFGFVALRSSAQDNSSDVPNSVSDSAAKTGELTQVTSFPDYNAPTAPTAGCGLLIGSGMTTGFGPSNYVTLARNTVNHAFANSVNGAPNQVAMFQTHDPWGNTVVKDAITFTGHGFTVFTMGQLAGFPLSNYRVVVIQLSDTFITDFNPAYNNAIPALQTYVNNGGILWIEGAFQSFGGESYAMPFGGQGNIDYNPSDNIVDFTSPMMTGVANPIVGNSASHATFSGLPAGAHVVVIRGAAPSTPPPPAGLALTEANAPALAGPVLYDFRPTCAPPPPPPVFVIDDVNKFEGQSGTTSFVYTVTKIINQASPGTVQFQTIDGSATVADNDYQENHGNLIFGANEVTKTITVLVNGDTKIEPNETFTVHLLFNPPVGVIGDADGQGLIQNDDFPTTPTPVPPPPTPTPTPPNRFEGDINRTALGVAGTGDGDVNIADQIQFQRFFRGFDCPSANERPRLDAGPRDTTPPTAVLLLGDGLFGASDGTAIDAYSRHDNTTDFNPNTPIWEATPVGGPSTIPGLTCTQPDAPESAAKTAPEPEAAASARMVRLVPGAGRRGSDITVDIEMAAQGNEAGTQFGLHFDPAVLAISDASGVNVNTDITLGNDAPAGTTLNVNAADAANGNIGIVENFNGASASVTAIHEGATRIARVKFHILDGAATGSSRVTFDDSVISGVTSDVNGIVLSASYDQNGSVSVTSSRGVTVSGRVTSSDGRGIRNATVTIVDRDGFARTVTTSSFGYYTFDDLAAATYTMGVSSRQYRYASRTVDVTDNLTDVNFTGLE